MTPKQEIALTKVPEMYTPLFKRAFEGKSRASGIKAFCIACVGFKRGEVTNCTSFACPLWSFRPYQDSEADEAE